MANVFDGLIEKAKHTGKRIILTETEDNRVLEAAEKAAADYGRGAIACTDYHDVLNDPEVDAISVCTPNLMHSIIWLDTCKRDYANFHLVFLMRLSRFLGLYPNLEGYADGDYFDLRSACFRTLPPQMHSDYLEPAEAARLKTLMRMRFDTMHLFAMSRAERVRCLNLLNDYYRLHLPDFPVLRSLEVLQELFD